MDNQSSLEKLSERVSQIVQQYHSLKGETEMMRKEIVTLKAEKERKDQEIERLSEEKAIKEIEKEESKEILPKP